MKKCILGFCFIGFAIFFGCKDRGGSKAFAQANEAYHQRIDGCTQDLSCIAKVLVDAILSDGGGGHGGGGHGGGGDGGSVVTYYSNTGNGLCGQVEFSTSFPGGNVVEYCRVITEGKTARIAGIKVGNGSCTSAGDLSPLAACTGNAGRQE
ncbi:MAG: hypothetical protein AB7T49_08865 [Oligoflexales bacterium]